MTVITGNLLAARDNRAPEPSVKADGSGYTWRMFYDSNRYIADMDTTSEALEVLITGYEALTDEEKLTARIQLAENVQISAKVSIASNLTAEQYETMQDWQWEVLLSEGDPSGWGAGDQEVDDEDSLDIWASTVPLVLLTTSYKPHTNIARPLSSEGDYEEVKNLIWLRPEHELDFLRSLSRIGYITFGKPQFTDANKLG